MRTPSWLSAHVVNVSVSHHEGGGVAFNELRHDTTCNSKRESALGPEGLPKSVYRSAGDIGQFLFAAYQVSLQGAALPDGFDTSRTVLIPKSSEVDAQVFLFVHLNL